jgi:hypothetical protein
MTDRPGFDAFKSWAERINISTIMVVAVKRPTGRRCFFFIAIIDGYSALVIAQTPRKATSSCAHADKTKAHLIRCKRPYGFPLHRCRIVVFGASLPTCCWWVASMAVKLTISLLQLAIQVA